MPSNPRRAGVVKPKFDNKVKRFWQVKHNTYSNGENYTCYNIYYFTELEAAICSALTGQHPHDFILMTQSIEFEDWVCSWDSQRDRRDERADWYQRPGSVPTLREQICDLIYQNNDSSILSWQQFELKDRAEIGVGYLTQHQIDLCRARLLAGGMPPRSGNGPSPQYDEYCGGKTPRWRKNLCLNQGKGWPGPVKYSHDHLSKAEFNALLAGKTDDKIIGFTLTGEPVFEEEAKIESGPDDIPF